MLTQEAGSASYFEDAYIARYLGYTLVEAGDLAVRNNQIFMKTLGGLLPVDVLLRRPNSDECDPLELSDRSAFGVAGLMQAAQSGKVAIANTLGSGLVESPVFMSFLPQLCQALLSEPLKMPGVATWWCGDTQSRRYVLDHLDELDIQPAYRRRGTEQTAAKQMAEWSQKELAARIEAEPYNFVAQERVVRSTAPTWNEWPVGRRVCGAANVCGGQRRRLCGDAGRADASFVVARIAAAFDRRRSAEQRHVGALGGPRGADHVATNDRRGYSAATRRGRSAESRGGGFLLAWSAGGAGRGAGAVVANGDVAADQRIERRAVARVAVLDACAGGARADRARLCRRRDSDAAAGDRRVAADRGVRRSASRLAAVDGQHAGAFGIGGARPDFDSYVADSAADGRAVLAGNERSPPGGHARKDRRAAGESFGVYGVGAGEHDADAGLAVFASWGGGWSGRCKRRA